MTYTAPTPTPAMDPATVLETARLGYWTATNRVEKLTAELNHLRDEKTRTAAALKSRQPELAAAIAAAKAEAKAWGKAVPAARNEQQ